MSSSENLFQKFDNVVNNSLGRKLNENIYFKTTILLIIAAYPILIRPQLPKFIENLFSNVFVRLLLITYIVYKVQVEKDVKLALVITVLFLFIMHKVNKQKLENEIKK